MMEEFRDIKEYINDLPSDKKRIATLSLIGDDNILWSKINEILKERKTGYQRLKEVYFLLRDYVKIADVERKKHGEILTPYFFSKSAKVFFSSFSCQPFSGVKTQSPISSSSFSTGF